jgi:hypothetical protein
MTLGSRYLFSAAMDVTADREQLFHEVYDTEHVPLILTVPGVVSATRFETRPLTMMLGGERKTMDPQGAPRFHALYELESPDVLLTDAWAKAVEQGRWPAQVRPHTTNRRHLLLQRLPG